MDKRQLHHVWTKIRHVRPWYFLILALVAGIVAVFALRHNYVHMVGLKNAVYAADKNNGDTEKALQNLQVYVTSHMNTELATGPDAIYPPIQLKYTYDRLVQKQAHNLSSANTQLYNDAQKHCEALDPTDFSGRNRVPCIQQYVKDHGSSLSSIPESLYKFDFVSPRWSPDLAGWSLLIAVLSVLAFIALVVIRRWLKRTTT